MKAPKFIRNILGVDAPKKVELGAPGTIFFSGMLAEEEYNKDLQGDKAIQVYDRMRRSDGQVKAALLACTLPLRVATWEIKPASDSVQDVEVAEYVANNLFNDMTITWDDFLRHVMLMLPFGFSVFEKVWELQDGKYKWRKLAPRLPKTIQRWWMDEEGGLTGVQQWIWKIDKESQAGTFRQIDIPIEKLLVFTHEREGSNYQGISLLRAAYKHWYYKDQLYRIDGIAAERHGVGLAVFTYPRNATTSQKDDVSAVGERLHAHERAYVALPDNIGFDLKGVVGQLHDIKGSIEHHDLQIVRSILAQFINLGSAEVGSYALSQDQSGFFLMGLRAIGMNIRETVNRFAIKQLVDYNWTVNKYPQLVVSGLDRIDVEKLSKAVAELVTAGVIMPDTQMDEELRRMLRLPAPQPKSPGPGEKEGQQGFSQPRSLSLSDWRPYRALRGEEQYVAFKEIKGKLDDAESKFVKAAKAVQDKQINRIVDMVSKVIERGDVEQVAKIGVPYHQQMADAIAEVLLDLYRYGQEQVIEEATKQRGTLKAQEKKVFAPLAAVPGAEAVSFINTRAAATANVLAGKMRSSMSWEALRQVKGGIVDRAALANTLTALSDRELAATAKFSVSESFNLGRQGQAKDMEDEIDHVVWSALLDENTCPPCEAMDGKEFAFPSEEWDEVAPPYKECEGHDRCRCVGVFVFKREVPAVPIAPEPEMPVLTYVGKIEPSAFTNAENVAKALPTKSREAIKAIEMHEGKGAILTFDSGKFAVGGDFDYGTGVLRVFQARNFSAHEAKWMIGHEAGHAASTRISSSAYSLFLDATMKEGCISSYSRNWYKSQVARGVQENFAECHKAFVLGGNELIAFKRYFPDTFEVFSKIWIELGGTV